MTEAAAPGAAAMERLRVYRERREALHADIREAAAAGYLQADISRASGMSRQWIASLMPDAPGSPRRRSAARPESDGEDEA